MVKYKLKEMVSMLGHFPGAVNDFALGTSDVTSRITSFINIYFHATLQIDTVTCAGLVKLTFFVKISCLSMED